MKPYCGYMVELRPKFQNYLFKELLKMHNCIECEKMFNKSSRMFYHYKNLRIKTIPLDLTKNVAEYLSISYKELNKNIIKTFLAEEERDRILNLGREIRKKKIKETFNIKPSAIKFLKRDKTNYYINVLEWLKETKLIEKLKKQKGIIKNIKGPIINKKRLIISYEAYSKTQQSMKKYNTHLPKRLYFTRSLMYFLGIRYGDGTFGGRVGIVNKNRYLIKENSKLLKKLFSPSEIKGDIFLYKRLNKKEIDKFKKFMECITQKYNIIKNYECEKSINGTYCFTIYIVNNFLERIMKDIYNDLIRLFKKLNYKQRGAFLAGFFDAEGNVNKLDKNFRWSQKIEHKVKIIKILLEKEGYTTRYDGSNIIIGSKEEDRKRDLYLFRKQVLPFIKHPDKKKEAIELLKGDYVKDSYKKIVKIIERNPGIDNYRLAEKMNRKRRHRELTALTDAGLLTRERQKVDERFKYFTTEKGLKWIDKE